MDAKWGDDFLFTLKEKKTMASKQTSTLDRRFYCTRREKWCTGTPEVGSLKCEDDHLYAHDGFQWRKQCVICSRISRANSDFCRTHCPLNLHSEKRGSSQLACGFFDNLEKELQVKILHRHYSEKGVSGSEFRVPKTPYRVDGLLVGTNVVIEVLGDFWHGNPDMFDKNLMNPVTKVSFGKLYRNTFTRMRRISEAGFTVFYVWESNILGYKPPKRASDILVEFTM